MSRSSQPAEPAAATPAASGALPGETHARCGRHPGRLRLGLHRLNWAAGGTERMKRETYDDRWGMELADLLSPEDNPTENKREVIFLILLAFFLSWYKWMLSFKTIIKKKKTRLTQDWTKPRCKHTSSKAKWRLKLSELSHVVSPPPPQCQQGYKSPKCCQNRLWILFFSFLLQLVSHHVCKLSAPVPEMNRNVVCTKPPAEKHHFTHIQQTISSLYHLFVHSYAGHLWLFTVRRRIYEELESVVVEWSATCWLKQAPFL